MDLSIQNNRGAIDMEARTAPAREENPRLREACQQFEGLLMGIMLKESLGATGGESGEDSASGFDQFRDFCVEQVASTLAESSSMGISDQLYEQLIQQGVSR